MQVIRYIRWSSLEQGNSDRSSEDRQRGETDAYAKRMGWMIDETLIDRGRSAFSGENLTKGELGKFAKRLDAGAFDPRETILLIEELDRLSRRPPGEMVTWIMPLLRKGLTIHVAKTSQVLTGDAMDRDFGAFVNLMSGAFSAHDFSRKQRDRGEASWEKRRKAAKGGEVLSRHRARKWLEWNAATKEYDPIPDRVAVIREMFDLRIAGWGKSGIAKLFNERAAGGDERYRVWTSTKRAPTQWTPSAIARIVQDEAVIGYLQYSRFPRGATKRVPIGSPVKVYPAVIDEDVFNRANQRRHTEQLRYQGRGRAVSNLIGRISRCGACGGAISALGSSRMRVNKDGSTSQHYFLYCSVNKMSHGKDCDNARGWPYRPIEQAIIDKLLTLAIDDQHFSNEGESLKLEGEVFRLQRKLTNLNTEGKRVLKLVRADDELAAEEYDSIRADIVATKAELAEAQQAMADAQGKVSPQEHIIRVSEVRSRMESDDPQERYEARMLVKTALASLVKEIKFAAHTGNVAVLLGDNERMFVINDGKVIEDWDFREKFPEAFDERGRIGKVRVYEGGTLAVDEHGNHSIVEPGKLVDDETLNSDQAEAMAGYRRRRAV